MVGKVAKKLAVSKAMRRHAALKKIYRELLDQLKTEPQETWCELRHRATCAGIDVDIAHKRLHKRAAAVDAEESE